MSEGKVEVMGKSTGVEGTGGRERQSGERARGKRAEETGGDFHGLR